MPYDYASIMHYPWNAFSQTWGKDTMKPIRRVRVPPYEHISPLDVKQAMLFYKCGGKIDLALSVLNYAHLRENINIH